jgi:N6-L-threonylcarbamoyladenine synthase
MTRILAIETSCDETAAAVVQDGRFILSNVVASQTDLHAQYGGVFPEMASRAHVETIVPVINEAMQSAHIGWDDLDAVAVTYGPGLAGSLLVGVNTAKGIALGRGLPLISVNHIEGHIYAHWLQTEAEGAADPDELLFPLLVLIFSGGHTELVWMQDHGQYERLGATLDDAAGEAFDKVGRLLGLPYPGGPAIEQSARRGDPTRFHFPRAWLEGSNDFSFSGLKTAVLRVVQEYSDPDSEEPTLTGLPVPHLAAAFQEAVVDVLAEKAAQAAAAHGATAILLSGGVSANRALRAEVRARAGDMRVYHPPIEFCTDNAAMIGAAAYRRFLAGHRDGWDLDVVPSLKLVQVG